MPDIEQILRLLNVSSIEDANGKFQRFMKPYVQLPVNNLLEFCNRMNRAIRAQHNRRGRPYHFKPKDITSSENFIGDLFYSPKIYNLLTQSYFPHAQTNDFVHYTSLEALEGIFQNQSLFLFWVKKRFNSEEFYPFYTTHQINGYLENEMKDAKNITKDYFYISLTDDEISLDDKDNLWNQFATQNKGVKLYFKIEWSNSVSGLELRKVGYSNSDTEYTPLPLLMEFSNIARSYQRNFVFTNIHKIGFFYISGQYRYQNEYRLLIKHDTARNLGFLGKKQVKGGNKYIKVPLQNENQYLKITMTKIVVRDSDTKSAIESIKKQNPSNWYSNILVELDK